MVRLKVIALFPWYCILTRFQFQMVRLKAGFAGQWLDNSIISIPDGSIKSCLSFVGFYLWNSISIPDGSIKSFSAEFAVPAHLIISIPDGSIKRGKESTASESYMDFNSRWVDEKEGCGGATRGGDWISIPDGSIKRRMLQNSYRNCTNFNSRWFD